ncbi:Panacea domain-containing protein [Gluconobacter cerinus]|uniref:Panacea domain-containing protein n=1 Tax=Gluconobacter cerinus TaxID=38307 RepID=UPI001B8D4217|nr:type II toxin-antitoxin system antitoxin SocA domain-containing protein [Gluconobacter cerinus]MBS1068814.1 SocA family protein [Gluconobacter cerinus]
MPNHRVEAIANEFLIRARAEGRSLTNMQLQKLPYIAHGWGLATQNSRLIANQPIAWPYGPVYPDLYQALRRYGPMEVADLVHENDGNPFSTERGALIMEPLTPNESALIDAVWAGYKNFDAFSLSNMTHRDGTPWTQTYNNFGRAPISDALIQAHYHQLMRERGAAN